MSDDQDPITKESEETPDRIVFPANVTGGNHPRHGGQFRPPATGRVDQELMGPILHQGRRKRVVSMPVGHGSKCHVSSSCHRRVHLFGQMSGSFLFFDSMYMASCFVSPSFFYYSTQVISLVVLTWTRVLVLICPLLYCIMGTPERRDNNFRTSIPHELVKAVAEDGFVKIRLPINSFFKGVV
jgi:hypothetical protein